MRDRRTVAVGIGELYVTRDTTLVLATYGLGSCVGVSVYDPIVRAGGLAHIMLPSSKESSCDSRGYKFADTAIPALIEESLRLGADRRRIVCKIAGGAQLLVAPHCQNGLRIGERNVEAVIEALSQYKLVPAAMNTGGSQGRTLYLYLDTGRVLVRTIGRGEVEL